MLSTEMDFYEKETLYQMVKPNTHAHTQTHNKIQIVPCTKFHLA